MKAILTCALYCLLVDNAYFEQKVNIKIFYESLCPDSLSFVAEQLHPNWQQISPYVNLKFVPFGKSASLEDKESFICQHGPKECMGNRIQSCALDSIPKSDDQVEFVNCFMKSFMKKDDVEHGQTCATLVGLDWNLVTDCYESDKGTMLQLQAEKETAKIGPSFIPTIVYNNAFDQNLQDNSLSNFKEVAVNVYRSS